MPSHKGGEKPCLGPCMRCGTMLEEGDKFCPDCGTIRAENVRCINHPAIDAVGVCVVCRKSLCANCGGYTDGRFHCRQHAA